MGKKSGFTLAEVLITLAIIGVVAALTIPAMVQDIQDKQFKTAWKKTYSILDQATRLIMADNGGTMMGLCGSNSQYNCFLNVYANRLNYIKKCYTGSATNECWVAGYKELDGSVGYNETDYARLILTNGTFLRFNHARDDCNYTAAWAPIPMCARIDIDINGFSGPNIVGKDIFSVWVQKDGIKPFGTPGDNIIPYYDCVSGEGYGCATLYLYQ